VKSILIGSQCRTRFRATRFHDDPSRD
jgi:hypothetical protein